MCQKCRLRWSGGLELWIEVGEIPVGDGLPLRLRFASDVTRENSLFGDHCWYLAMFWTL